MGSFVFLDQTRYDLSPDVTVLGCTLFSRVSEVHKEQISYGLNDFYHIRNWTVDDHTAAHEADLGWLNRQASHITASEPHRKIVVFTHHSPITQDPRAVDPRHVNRLAVVGFCQRSLRAGGLEESASQIMGIWTHALQCQLHRGGYREDGR